MIIVGSRSPDFTAEAIVHGVAGIVSLEQYRGQYVLLFFYPADFSFVCPSELHALQRHLPEFHDRHVEVLGVSVDSIHTHLAWLATPVSEGGIAGTTFTLISDTSQRLSRAYGVLDEASGAAFRGVFIIDREGIVQYGSLNTLAFGRSIQELLRVIDGIQFTERHGHVCPANWTPGDLSLTPSVEGQREFLERSAQSKSEVSRRGIS